jgi:lipoic acid synthetase
MSITPNQTERIDQRLPRWLTKPIVATPRTRKVSALLSRLQLNTICQSARCPNKGTCFARGTATFMILGNLCTRRCAFCAVAKGQPAPVDPEEPSRIVQCARELRLQYVVITSVTRDDLPDGGAYQFAETIKALRRIPHGPRVEVLTPDFGGSLPLLATVVGARPDVFNHNVETVPRLYGRLRPLADYRRSLFILEEAKRTAGAMMTKSGIMVGLGECRQEILAVMRDLRQAGCDLLTIGQYLRPSPRHYPVKAFVSPQLFEEYRLIAQDLGFLRVYSAPLVRSSFHAEDLFDPCSQRRKGDENQHHRQAFRVN